MVDKNLLNANAWRLGGLKWLICLSLVSSVAWSTNKVVQTGLHQWPQTTCHICESSINDRCQRNDVALPESDADQTCIECMSSQPNAQCLASVKHVKA